MKKLTRNNKKLKDLKLYYQMQILKMNYFNSRNSKIEMITSIFLFDNFMILF